MKRSLLVLLTLSAALMAQIVTNGFFEAPDTEYGAVPPGWTISGNAKGWGFINDDGMSNSTSLECKANRNVASQAIKLAKNTDYTLFFQVKNIKAAPKISVHNKKGAELASYALSDDIQDVWFAGKVNFRTGDKEEHTLRLVGNYREPQGIARFDNIEIVLRAEVDKRPEPTPPKINTDNLALHKKYTFGAKPNYRYCTDPDDITQLTDGGRTVGYFWTQKSTVGWHQRQPIIVTVDLEKEEPICGASWTCAAGVAGVHWPISIQVFSSNDKKSWKLLGDLVYLGTRQESPDPFKYRVFTYQTKSFRTSGRYVAFFAVAKPGSGLFCDEIEVFKGDQACLDNPTCQNEFDMPLEDYVKAMALHSILAKRITEDIDKLSARFPDAASTPKKLLADYQKELDGTPMIIPKSTMLPIDIPLHEKVLAVNAFAMKEAGHAKPFAWKVNRWANNSLTDFPQRNELKPAEIKVVMMRNEVRSDAFAISNPTGNPLPVKISAEGMGQELKFQLRKVIPTWSPSSMELASALEPLELPGEVVIPSGCSYEFWGSFLRPVAEAGVYSGALLVQAGNETLRIPVKLDLAKLTFPAQPSLNVGGWQYAGTYRDNYKANIEIMRDFYVNSPWARTEVLPKNAEFDGEGRLTNADKLDFAAFDQWIQDWPGAKLYCIAHFLPRNHFFKENVGTTRFATMLGEYFRAIEARMDTHGLKREQLVYLFKDEPSTKEADEVIKSWMVHLRKAGLKMRWFDDPTYSKPETREYEVFKLHYIVCPNTPMMLREGKSFHDFYVNLCKDTGIELWLYSCSGPAKELDPIAYWRGQMWHCFEMGGKGTFYWAFGCTGGIGSSWTNFGQGGIEFGPYFVAPGDGKQLHGKQSEAIREGVQDYEYLLMLQDKCNKTKDAALKAELDKIVAQALEPITSDNLRWKASFDRSVLDACAAKVLELLAK